MQLKKLSSREKKIVKALIKASDYLTVKELAEQIGVSKRTVYRELSSLKEILKKSDLLLESKPGVGISIEGNQDLIEKYEADLIDTESNKNLTPQERKLYIIEEFLFSDRFQKMTALAYKLSVTEATISYDLNKVSDWFEEKGLSLVRKQGVGVYLKGSEADFRRAVIDFLYENMGEDEVLTLIRNNLDDNFTSQDKKTTVSNIKSNILEFISMDISAKLEKTVNRILHEVDFNMVNSSYIGLVIYLSLAIKRLQSGEKIHVNKNKLNKLKVTKEYNIAEKIADRLEEIFALEIPEDEKGYITMHLKGAKLRKNIELMDEPLDDGELEAMKLARVLVREVEEELGVDLADDFNLISGLVTHLEPAISRLKMGLEIRNPILDDLKSEYKQVFSATKKVTSVLAEELECNIPDAEIGFLTMHIAAAVENADNGENKVRALVVCSSGIGSSKILATRLKKTMDNVEIVDEVSALEVNEATINQQDIDLVISTVSIDKYEGEMVVVTPILLPDEVQKINQKINEIKMKDLESNKKRLSSKNKEIKLEDKVKVMAKLSDDIMKLIDNFNLIKIDNKKEKKEYAEIIKIVCQTDFLPDGSDLDLIYDSLEAREEKGATIIPEIKLSLLHARTEGIQQPFIGLVVLEDAIMLPNSNKVKEKVDRIVVLLAPEELLTEEIKLMSKFSASIIENKDFYNVVREGSGKKFLNYLRNLIDDYYQDLIN
jgi:mannitol operon transcriptional antiterminator